MQITSMELQLLHCRVLELLQNVDFLSAKWKVYTEEDRNRVIIEKDITTEIVDCDAEVIGIVAGIKTEIFPVDEKTRSTSNFMSDLSNGAQLAVKTEFDCDTSKAFDCAQLPLTINQHEKISLRKNRVAEKGNSERVPSKSFCQICLKTFSSKSYLLKHQLNVHKLANFNGEENDNHVGNLSMPSDSSMVCLHCGKVFNNFHTLKNHEKSVHAAKDFPCDEEGCQKRFVSQKKLEDHVEFHHRGLTVSCHDCGKEFRSRSRLVEHVNTIHRGVRRKCCFCDKQFVKAHNLNYHMDNSHSELLDPSSFNQICDICGKAFTSKGSLYTHRSSKHKKKIPDCSHVKSEGNRVTRESVFCPICGREFSKNKSYLKLHVQMVHSGQKWRCDCGKDYGSQAMLKRHVESIHKGIRYNCPYCDKTFSVKSTLKVHLDAIHRGIKHTCPICNQSFAQSGDMKIHVKAVHKGVKSKCDICGKEFNRAPEMRRHRKAVHKALADVDASAPAIGSTKENLVDCGNVLSLQQ